MAKMITFTMTVIYDETDIYAENALHAIEHEMSNIDGIYEWTSEQISNEDVEYDEEE